MLPPEDKETWDDLHCLNCGEVYDPDAPEWEYASVGDRWYEGEDLCCRSCIACAP